MRPAAKRKLQNWHKQKAVKEIKDSKKAGYTARAEARPKKVEVDDLSELKTVDELFATVGEEDEVQIRDEKDVSSDESSAGAFHDVEGSDDDGPARMGITAADLHEAEEGDDAMHPEELKAIKEQDPEFYEFLLKQDKALLDFSLPADPDKEEEEDEEDIPIKYGEKKVKAPKPQGRLIDMKRLKNIHAAAKESFTACRVAINAFHTAVRAIEVRKPMDPLAPQEEVEDTYDGSKRSRKPKRNKIKSARALKREKDNLLRIEDDEVFSEVIEWSIANLLGVFAGHAGQLISDDRSSRHNRKTRDGKDADGKQPGPYDPSHYSRWKRVKVIALIFWDETFMLLQHLTDGQMLEYVLRHCGTTEALSWLWPFRGLRQCFIKRACQLWSQSKDHNVRVWAFLFLRNVGAMVLHAPDNPSTASVQLQNLFKMVLNAFADMAAGGYSWKSLSRFRFMENCMIELLKLDNSTGYRMGYQCVRQLAKILRDACISVSTGVSGLRADKPLKNKKGVKKDQTPSKKKRTKQLQANALVTWAFVRSLYLWTKAVGAVPHLRPLAYPLSMVIMGAIKTKILNIQFFPFVYHCLVSLNRMGATLEAFVPVCAHLLRLIGIVILNMEKGVKKRAARMAKDVKEKKTLDQSVKAPELDVLIKFTEAQLCEVMVLELMGSGICHLFYDHLGLLSQSPAFPEITSPVLLHLRRYAKSCRSEPMRKQLKILVEKAEMSANDVRVRREALTEVPDAKKLLLFEPTTEIARARIEALKRKATEEQSRVEAELRNEARQEAAAEAGEEPKKRKRAKKKPKTVELDQTPQEIAEEAVGKARESGQMPDRDKLEDMDFSSGDEDSEGSAEGSEE